MLHPWKTFSFIYLKQASYQCSFCERLWTSSIFILQLADIWWQSFNVICALIMQCFNNVENNSLQSTGGVRTKYLLIGDANQMLHKKIITEPYMFCDESLTSIKNWKTFQTSFKRETRKNVKAKRCVMSMSESYYHPVCADNIFTVLSNLHKHVLLMYFHCTKSKHHKLNKRLLQ